MKKPLILLGAAGSIGRVIAWDWLQSSPRHEIILADLDPRSLAELCQQLGPRSRPVTVDLKDKRRLVEVLKQGDLVINSTSHHFNLPVMRAALEARCHYLDLGGLFHFTRRQLKWNASFLQKGLTAILGMGCAPGLTNLMAREVTEDWEEVESVDIRIGGVDHRPRKNPDEIPYSFRTLLEELTLRPAVFDQGKWSFADPRSGQENYRFPAPVETQSLFYTLHSEVATLPLYFKDRGIRRVTFRIGLDPELCRRILNKKTAAAPLPLPPTRVLPPDDDEMALVEARGKRVGKEVRGRMICHTKAKGPWTAGDLNTACPASAVAEILDNRSFSCGGVFAPEDIVPWHELKSSLESRGFIFHQERIMNISKAVSF